MNMSKGVSAFASVQDGPLSIDRYLDYVFATSRATDWASLNQQEFVEVAAAIFAHLNHAHPFREGTAARPAFSWIMWRRVAISGLIMRVLATGGWNEHRCLAVLIAGILRCIRRN